MITRVSSKVRNILVIKHQRIRQRVAQFLKPRSADHSQRWHPVYGQFGFEKRGGFVNAGHLGGVSGVDVHVGVREGGDLLGLLIMAHHLAFPSVDVHLSLSSAMACHHPLFYLEAFDGTANPFQLTQK